MSKTEKPLKLVQSYERKDGKLHVDINDGTSPEEAVGLMLAGAITTLSLKHKIDPLKMKVDNQRRFITYAEQLFLGIVEGKL